MTDISRKEVREIIRKQFSAYAIEYRDSHERTEFYILNLLDFLRAIHICQPAPRLLFDGKHIWFFMGPAQARFRIYTSGDHATILSKYATAREPEAEGVERLTIDAADLLRRRQVLNELVHLDPTVSLAESASSEAEPAEASDEGVW